METNPDAMLISEFKAKCIAVLKTVARTRKPLIVTLRGKPLVKIEALTESDDGRTLGAQAETVQIRGNVLQPVLSGSRRGLGDS